MPTTEKRTCRVCGKEFLALVTPHIMKRRGGQTLCSTTCRSAARAMAYSEARPAAFWAKVDRAGGPDACWEWQGVTARNGYGRIGAGNGKLALTHRMAWTLTNGPIPDFLFVCHRCDNPPCCNPAHLFLGTHADNVRDMLQKGRGHHLGSNRVAVRGERHGQAKISDQQRSEIISSSEPTAVLAERYGLHPSRVSKIRCVALGHVLPRIPPDVRAAIVASTGTQGEIAKRFGVSQATVSLIKSRHRKGQA